MSVRLLKRRLKRFVCGRFSFYSLVLLLGLTGLLYFIVIHILQIRAVSIQTELTKPPAPDLLEDPRGFFARTRNDDFKKYEWAFTALFYSIPLSMSVVGILCLIVALRREIPWKSERGLNAGQRERAERLESSLKQKFKR